MNGTQPISTRIRPLPYYNTPVSEPERELAARLRQEFVPKIARRLPGHHLRGFDVRFLLFVDDILLLGARMKTLEEVYIYLDLPEVPATLTAADNGLSQ
jgi:hypothetical protein